jgi:3-oxoacyl-[acyl-carrier-protein] synthase II
VRYFITGMSYKTGFGDESATLEGLRRGKSAVSRHPEFSELGLPCDIGASLPDGPDGSSPEDWARAAIRECRPPTGPTSEWTGLAASIGWEAWTLDQYRDLITSECHHLPTPLPPGVSESNLHRDLGLGGPLCTSHSACAASTQLISDALSMLRKGEARACIAGGSDSRLHPVGIIGYARIGALAIDPDLDPSECCRPFDAGHRGFVIGEGAAFFHIESADKAEQCRSTPIAEILAIASTGDAHRLTDPEASGHMIRECLELAIQRSGLEREAINIISTHGTGTPANDHAEAAALNACFGKLPTAPYGLALKSSLGHCAMASGSVELAASIAAIRSGFLPPVLNLEQPIADAKALKWVTDTTTPPPPDPVILKNSFGFGGQNSTAIIRIHRLDEHAIHP